MRKNPKLSNRLRKAIAEAGEQINKANRAQIEDAIKGYKQDVADFGLTAEKRQYFREVLKILRTRLKEFGPRKKNSSQRKTKYKYPHNYIGLQIKQNIAGKTLSGNVKDAYKVNNKILLIVNYSNGKPWPFDPHASDVTIIDENPRKKNPAKVSNGFILTTFARIYNQVVFVSNSKGDPMVFAKQKAKVWKTENGAAAAAVRIEKSWGEPVVIFPVSATASQIKAAFPGARISQNPKKKKVTRRKNPVTSGDSSPYDGEGKHILFVFDKTGPIKFIARHGKGWQLVTQKTRAHEFATNTAASNFSDRAQLKKGRHIGIMKASLPKSFAGKIVRTSRGHIWGK